LCNTSNPQIKTYRVGLFTIIDRTEYTHKKGEKAGQVERDQKRLFVAKKDTWEILARRAKTRVEAGQTLRGAQFLVSRGSDQKCANVGNDFEFENMANLSEFPDVTEFDYEELFKPDVALVGEYLRALDAAGPVSGEPEDENTVVPF